MAGDVDTVRKFAPKELEAKTLNDLSKTPAIRKRQQ